MFTCEFCQKVFADKKNNSSNKFCDIECYNNNRLIKKVEVNCEFCQILYLPKNGDAKKFCSKKCFISSIYKPVEYKCRVCENIYIPKNKQVKEYKVHTCPNCIGSEEIICPICDKKFSCNKSKIKKRKTLCCSVNCKAIAQRKDWDKLTRNTLKQRWVSEFGIENFVCIRCNHDKPYNIVLHHIIYVKNGGTNQPDNLEPLCLNCHGEEHYDKGPDYDYIRTLAKTLIGK